MPKIYEYFGLIFFFYSNDHLPLHVHVKQGEKESKFILHYKDGILQDINHSSGRNPLNARHQKICIKFVKKYHRQIAAKWHEFFVLHKTPVCRKIKRKLK